MVHDSFHSHRLRTRERSRIVARNSVVVCEIAARASQDSAVARARARAIRRQPTERAQFVLQGEIDVANADQVLSTMRRVARGQPGSFVVDCTDLRFIDAAGISTLIQMFGELDAEGRSLRLAHPSPLLTRMLQVLELTFLLAPIPVAPFAA